MKRLVAVAASLATMTLAVPVAQAQDIGKAEFLSSINVVSKNKATLRVRYSCATGEHLWVSAKESKSGKQRSALSKEGSSKAASAWWQSHRNRFSCDDKRHSAEFTIDKVEPGSKGKLRKGRAWVQFCVTTGDTEEDSKLIVSKSGWVKVQ